MDKANIPPLVFGGLLLVWAVLYGLDLVSRDNPNIPDLWRLFGG